MSSHRDNFELAAQFDAAFQRVYLAMHRRDGTARALSGISRSVLMHLMLSGPVTIGEATKHFGRSQSVVSEIVSQLESNGLVERRKSDIDRRRVLVWLTDSGMEALRRESSVLSHEALAGALGDLDSDDLVTALRVLDSIGRAHQQDSTEYRADHSVEGTRQ